MKSTIFWVGCLLTLTAISGCLHDEDPTQAAMDSAPLDAPTPVNTTLNDPEGSPAEPQFGDWFSLPLEASAEGTLHGYRVPILNGTAVPVWHDEDTRLPIIEFAMLGDGDVDSLYLLIFDPVTGDVIEEVAQFGNLENQATPQGLFGSGGGFGINRWSLSTSIRPDHARLDGMQDTGDVAFTIGATGTGNATIGVRFMTADPVLSESESLSWEVADFKAKVATGTEWSLEPTGTGSGLSLSFFMDHYAVYFPNWGRYATEDLIIDEPIPASPARNVNQLTVSTPSTTAKYASSVSLVWTEAHAGLVGIEFQGPDGETISSLSPLIPDPVVNSISAQLRCSGTGSASASISLTSAGTPTLFPQAIVLGSVSLATSIEDLTGASVEPTNRLDTGLPI